MKQIYSWVILLALIIVEARAQVFPSNQPEATQPTETYILPSALTSEAFSGLVLFSGVKRAAPLTFALAASDGYVRIDNGAGELVEKIVSRDAQKPTPMTITAATDNPRIVIEGNIIALDCNNNQVTSIDCSQALTLRRLRCNLNALRQLDLSSCQDLEYVYCDDNEISDLHVGSLPLLKELTCNHNQIAKLDLKSLPSLVAFSCDFNKLESINFSTCPKLKNLYCKKNRIQTLDLTPLRSLELLSCESNKIKSLDLKLNDKLRIIYCGDNLIEALDLTAQSFLSELNCKLNQLTTLNLSHLAQLTELYCFDNQLTELNLSANKNLTVLSCGANRLQRLDLSGLARLSSFSSSFNEISQLSLVGCTSLHAAAADHNLLPSLDLSSCDSLTLLFVHNNSIGGHKSLELVQSLPLRSEEEALLVFLNQEEYPDDPEANDLPVGMIEAAQERGWTVTNGETSIGVSLEEVRGTKVQLHPTITDGYIQIHGQYLSYSLFDADGRLILRDATEPQIDLRACCPGVYYAHFRLENQAQEVARIIRY